MDYITEADLKSYLRIPADDTTDDAELALAITAASRAIDKAANRTFATATGSATARVFSAEYDTERQAYVVAIDDLMTTTGLVVKCDVDGDWSFEHTATETPRMWPLNAASQDLPWTELLFQDTTFPTRVGSVEVTADWGWDAIPSAIKQACLIQASRLFKRRDAPFGVAGSPEMGNELRLLARLDPDVEVLVNDYRRWWV